jgi:fatty-acyl-CoA synthase
VVAVVRLADGADGSSDVLRSHCRAHLGGYKVPSEIRIVEEALPRTASGKLRRALLRASLGGE